MGGGSLPPVGAIGGPPMGSSQPPPSQMMGGPGMVGVLPQSGPPQMWSTSLPRSPSQPNPNIIPNGGSMNPMNLLQSPFTSTQQQQQIMVTQQTPAGTPHYGPTPHQRGRAMAQQHQQQHSALPQTGGMIQQPAQQMPQQQQQQQCHSPHFDSSGKFRVILELLIRFFYAVLILASLVSVAIYHILRRFIGYLIMETQRGDLNYKNTHRCLRFLCLKIKIRPNL